MTLTCALFRILCFTSLLYHFEVGAEECRIGGERKVLFPTLKRYSVSKSCDLCDREELEEMFWPYITRAEEVIDGQTCKRLNATGREIYLGVEIDDTRIAELYEFAYSENVQGFPLRKVSDASLHGHFVTTLAFRAAGRANYTLHADEVINGKKTRIGTATVLLRASDKYNDPPKGRKRSMQKTFGPLKPLPPPPPEQACFPGETEVQLMNGAVKRMDQLVTGDRVLAKNGQYSPVIMFTHKDSTAIHRFIELQTHNTKLLLSYGHYLQLNDRLGKAGFARVGDLVEIASGRQVPITAIRSVSSQGLYNPQTSHGTIVVNGVVSSCYTEAIPAPAAHALLAVLRAAYNMIGMQRGRQHFSNEYSALIHKLNH